VRLGDNLGVSYFMEKRLIKKGFFKLFVVTAFCLLSVLLSHIKAFAQLNDIYVYPNVVNLDFRDAGTKFVSKAIFIENPTQKNLRVRAYVQAWDVDKFGSIVFLDNPNEVSLNDYMKFNPKEFDIAPGQRQTVRLTAKMPENFTGEMRSIIFFETVTPRQTVIEKDNNKINISVNFKTRYGVVVYAYKGDVFRNAVLESLNIDKSSENPYIIANINNPGNIHCNVEGELKVYTGDSNEIIKNSLSRYTVLPGNTQSFRIQLPLSSMSDGKYNAEIKLTFKDTTDRVQVIEGKTSFEYKKQGSKGVKSKLNKQSAFLDEDKVKPTAENKAVPIYSGNMPKENTKSEINLKN